MRELLRKTPPRTLPDYMILEMLLYAVFPRGDTKPLAKLLLDKFSSFAEMLNADLETLKEIDGVGDAVAVYFKLLLELFSRLHIGINDKQMHVLNNWSSVVNYCQLSIGFLPMESLRVLFLNKRNMLICDEEMQRGTVDQVSIFPREIVRKALQHGAVAIILVHNHPSGDPMPSQADLDMTAQVANLLELMNIKLHDHLICAGHKTYSFRSHRLLK
jgi:DNA repair protein RadC